MYEDALKKFREGFSVAPSEDSLKRFREGLTLPMIGEAKFESRLVTDDELEDSLNNGWGMV
jgi:hypothetical protein